METIPSRLSFSCKQFGLGTPLSQNNLITKTKRKDSTASRNTGRNISYLILSWVMQDSKRYVIWVREHFRMSLYSNIVINLILMTSLLFKYELNFRLFGNWLNMSLNEWSHVGEQHFYRRIPELKSFFIYAVSLRFPSLKPGI